MARRDESRTEEGRGAQRVNTGRDPYTERHEEKRRGGGRYDAGPGREQLPTSPEMDRPRTAQATFDRMGDRRESIRRGIRTIQENEER